MKVFKQFVKGILLRGETSDPSDNQEGSAWYNSTVDRFKGYAESAVRIFVSEDQSQTLSNKKLVDNSTEVVDNSDATKKIKFDAGGTTGTSTTIQGVQTVDRTLTLPDVSDTLVSRTSTDQAGNRLFNKDLDAATTKIVDSTDTTKKVSVDVAGSSTGTTTTLDFNQTTNRTVTIPDASTTLVGTDTADALSNKTQINVDNLQLDGNTVSSTDTNGNVIVAPNGTGKTQINSDVELDGKILVNGLVISPITSSDSMILSNLAGSGVINLTDKVLLNSDLRFAVETDASTTGASANPSFGNIIHHRFTNASLTSIGGISSTSSDRFVVITNGTGASFYVNDEDTGVTAANRIRTGTSAPVELKNNSSMSLIFDNTSSRWRIISGAATSSAGTISAKMVFVTPLADVSTVGANAYTAAATTLTKSSNGAFPSGVSHDDTTQGTDGVSITLNDIVVLVNEASSANNGIYKLTTVGSGAAPWVLTRVNELSSASQFVQGLTATVRSGNFFASTTWVLDTTVTTLGTDPVTFSKYDGYKVAKGPIGASASSISAGSFLRIANRHQNQFWFVQGAGAPVDMLNQPFGVSSVAPLDGTTVTLTGFSDANTVRLINGDVTRGARINGDANLSYGRSITLRYNAEQDRFFEVSRNF